MYVRQQLGNTKKKKTQNIICMSLNRKWWSEGVRWWWWWLSGWKTRRPEGAESAGWGGSGRSYEGSESDGERPDLQSPPSYPHPPPPPPPPRLSWTTGDERWSSSGTVGATTTHQVNWTDWTELNWTERPHTGSSLILLFLQAHIELETLVSAL